MQYNIIALLCAAMLIGKSWGSTAETKRDKCLKNKTDYRDVADFEPKSRTWFVSDTFLKVHHGVLTIELLTNISYSPHRLVADELDVVELREDFSKIRCLEWLSLAENLIREIRDYVFACLPNLRYLNLGRNRIHTISANGFRGLCELRVLILKHNFLKVLGGSISDEALPNLTQLYVQSNQLNAGYEIYENKFELCHSNLSYLYLTNNFLRSFSPGKWKSKGCLKSLTHLYLEKNRISEFSVGDMKLKALSLNENELDDIPEINPELKFFSISKNRITNVRNFSINNQNLTRLILSQNSIGRWMIHATTFNFPSLEHLALDNCCIRIIAKDVFKRLKTLRSLDLSGNVIARLPARIFKHLTALLEMHIGSNELTSFPGKAAFGFTAGTKLKYLDISYNNVKNVSKIETSFFPSLRHLNVIGNPLGLNLDLRNISKDIEVLYTP